MSIDERVGSCAVFSDDPRATDLGGHVHPATKPVRAARRSCISAVAALVAVLIFWLLPTPAIAQGESDICTAQKQALDTVQGAGDAHNAKPHVFVIPDQAAAFAAYDAEAAQLESVQKQAIARYASCLAAQRRLVPPGSDTSTFRTTATEGTRTKIESARSGIPSGYRAEPPEPGKIWKIPKGTPLRPLYDAIRPYNPVPALSRSTTIRLQGQLRPKIGAPDPSFPGRLILRAPGRADPPLSDVSPDHIVPLTEVINLPGFTELSADNMVTVANSPVNFQWLPRALNREKLAGSIGRLTDLDPQWQEDQVALEDRVRAELKAAIEQLLQSQG